MWNTPGWFFFCLFIEISWKAGPFLKVSPYIISLNISQLLTFMHVYVYIVIHNYFTIVQADNYLQLLYNGLKNIED